MFLDLSLFIAVSSSLPPIPQSYPAYDLFYFVVEVLFGINHPLSYKLVLLGDCGDGKSSIVEKYVNNESSQIVDPTIAFDFYKKGIVYAGKTYSFQVPPSFRSGVGFI